MESRQSIESQIRRHIQQRAVRALQAKLEAEPERGSANRNWHVFFPGLSWNGRRLAAVAFLVILALFALVPAMRAQVQAQIQEIAGDWFHFSAPGKETITLGYNNQGKFVDLAQSAGTHLEALPQGEHLVVNGSTAVFVEDFARSARELQKKIPAISIVIEYNYTHTNLLAWDMGEIRMQMVSNLPKDEMVHIAGSLAPMQSRQLPAAAEAGSKRGVLETIFILLIGWAEIGLGAGTGGIGAAEGQPGARHQQLSAGAALLILPVCHAARLAAGPAATHLPGVQRLGNQQRPADPARVARPAAGGRRNSSHFPAYPLAPDSEGSGDATRAAQERQQSRY